MKVKKTSNPGDYNAAKDYAINYLSYRPRTVWEVREKLTEKGFNPEIVYLVIDFLKEYKFVNDEEFIRMWVDSRIRNKPCGKRKMYYDLVKKGINKDLVSCGLEEVSDQLEQEMALKLIEKKCSKSDMDLRKMEGFLLRRGFNPYVVKKMLNKFEKNVTK